MICAKQCTVQVYKGSCVPKLEKGLIRFVYRGILSTVMGSVLILIKFVCFVIHIVSVLINVCLLL
jgi:hypothetical protein